MKAERKGLKQRMTDKAKCVLREKQIAQKVGERGAHQNANVVQEIYCRVLVQFKAGSLFHGASPKPQLGPNKSAIKS